MEEMPQHVREDVEVVQNVIGEFGVLVQDPQPIQLHI